jgi:hypothetical protein
MHRLAIREVADLLAAAYPAGDDGNVRARSAHGG